tara:strand:+ start:2530 stop:2925 length:396 start_codon:yes stop_codon:yes gene_type:complete
MINNHITKKKLSEFGIVIGFCFPLFIGWLIPFIFGHQFRQWSLYIGIPALIFALIRPQLLFYPYKFWIKLGNLLGWINSHIILGLVFVLILLPISMIMKLFGYDPLKKPNKRVVSYRENKQNFVIDLKRIF